MLPLTACSHSCPQSVYNMNPTCSTPAANRSTATLAQALGTAQGNGINFGANLECTAQEAAYLADATAINRQLYCGFYQVRNCERGLPLVSAACVKQGCNC